MKFLKPTFLTALLALIVNTVYAGCKARASFTQNGNSVLFYDDSIELSIWLWYKFDVEVIRPASSN
jgi:hypothetical protein